MASGAPILEFSTTELASAIADYIDDLDATPAQMDALIDDLRVDVMTATAGADAMQRVEAFDSDLVSFQDFWEANLERSSFRFLWLCHAIVLAVRLYDEAKGGATA